LCGRGAFAVPILQSCGLSQFISSFFDKVGANHEKYVNMIFGLKLIKYGDKNESKRIAARRS